MFSVRNKKVKLNSKFAFPITRDDLGFNFDEKKYMHNLKQISRSMNFIRRRRKRKMKCIRMCKSLSTQGFFQQ